MTTAFGPNFDATALAKLAPELSDVFTAAGFTTDGVAGHLGPEVTEALFRGEPAPVALAAHSESHLDLLIRFFLLHEHLPATLLGEAVGARLATQLLDANVALADTHGKAYIALDIRPHTIVGANRLIFSDVDASLVD
ncbi:rRNA methyltransferase, partial [Corynebacterium sp. MC-09]|nr:rRNA methyltransferase [Corynebacterium parakroppenstedtii]